MEYDHMNGSIHTLARLPNYCSMHRRIDIDGACIRMLKTSGRDFVIAQPSFGAAEGSSGLAIVH